MLKFGVREEKKRALENEMRKFGICEKDLLEKFVRASGPGGQNVNKVASCVYLKHIPSGFEVKIQKARSQALNRFLARRELVRKIGNDIMGKENKEEKRREEIRRTKQRRSRRAKKKMLEQKRAHAQKKELRVKPSPENEI